MADEDEFDFFLFVIPSGSRLAGLPERRLGIDSTDRLDSSDLVLDGVLESGSFAWLSWIVFGAGPWE